MRFAATDWLGVYPCTAAPLHLTACVWRVPVEPWAGEASFVVPALPPMLPGEYTVAYHLGRHADHVAGSAPLRVSFPRRALNRFDALKIGRPRTAEGRELRFLLALDEEDMHKEQADLMTTGTCPHGPGLIFLVVFQSLSIRDALKQSPGSRNHWSTAICYSLKSSCSFTCCHCSADKMRPQVCLICRND